LGFREGAYTPFSGLILGLPKGDPLAGKKRGERHKPGSGVYRLDAIHRDLSPHLIQTIYFK